MKKTIAITEEVLKEWSNNLGLVLEKQNRVPVMVLSALSMETLSEDVPEGFYLGKQMVTMKAYPVTHGTFFVQSEITRRKKIKKSEYIFCQTMVNDAKGQTVLSIETVLVKPEEPINVTESPAIDETQKEEECSFVFFAEQVQQFCRLSGDPNPIHQTERPVVPGMMLLLAFEEAFLKKVTDISKVTVHYIHPLYSGEKAEINEVPRGFSIEAAGRNIASIIISGGIKDEKIKD